MNGTKILLLVMLALLLVLGAGAGTACEEQRGSINGTIMDINSETIAGAIIRANRSGYPSALLRADEDGYYSIKEAQSGKWKVEFYDENGFPLGMREVTVKGGETSLLDFTAGEEPLPENMPRLINVP